MEENKTEQGEMLNQMMAIQELFAGLITTAEQIENREFKDVDPATWAATVQFATSVKEYISFQQSTMNIIGGAVTNDAFFSHFRTVIEAELNAD